MKVKQDHIRRVLDSKRIPYTEVDVAAPHQLDEKVFMQKTLQLDDDDLVALPPQVFNDKNYRGDYDAFFKAIECEYLFEYLDLEVPSHEVEYTLRHG
ncbi:hypothetical protein LSAT2_000646 [Lamellibrachia satsuma]|nr:hypothetical protein LSAT2_000646 [Lamellibrachia satsuma]